MIDLYDVGDGRARAAPRHAREMPRPGRHCCSKQKLDIDATIDELDRFIAMVEAAEASEIAAE